jgi:predicted metal-binding protein
MLIKKYDSVLESIHLTTCFTDADKKKYNSVLENIHLTTCFTDTDIKMLHCFRKHAINYMFYW